jgi:hypothetical protein
MSFRGLVGVPAREQRGMPECVGLGARACMGGGESALMGLAWSGVSLGGGGGGRGHLECKRYFCRGGEEEFQEAGCFCPVLVLVLPAVASLQLSSHGLQRCREQPRKPPSVEGVGEGEAAHCLRRRALRCAQQALAALLGKVVRKGEVPLLRSS